MHKLLEICLCNMDAYAHLFTHLLIFVHHYVLYYLHIPIICMQLFTLRCAFLLSTLLISYSMAYIFLHSRIESENEIHKHT